jgi:hypothetical protein
MAKAPRVIYRWAMFVVAMLSLRPGHESSDRPRNHTSGRKDGQR